MPVSGAEETAVRGGARLGGGHAERAPGHSELRAVDAELGVQDDLVRCRLVDMRGELDRLAVTGRRQGSLAGQFCWPGWPGLQDAHHDLLMIVGVEEVSGPKVLVPLLVLGAE